MQNYGFSAGVNLLLIDCSNEKVEIIYNSNPSTMKMPLIGIRPPYYCNPRWEPYYPVI